MDEGPPKISNIESHAAAKRKVVELLLKNPDDLAPLIEYAEMREKIARTPREQIEVALDLAEIKLDAGRTESAREAFADAAEYAYQMGEDELHNRILTRMKALGL